MYIGIVWDQVWDLIGIPGVLNVLRGRGTLIIFG